MRIVCEWGVEGALALSEQVDALVVVDVLSFSTCVDITCARGARIYPFPIQNRDEAQNEARRLGAELAGKRSDLNAKYTLSAPSLQSIPKGTKLLLPSPNGSRISFAVRDKPVFAACLRNAAAVAVRAAMAARDGTLAVIPAGELWPDGGLRPAIEDLLGAGCVVSALEGAHLSPEAMVIRDAYRSSKADISQRIIGSVSGQELITRGYVQDVEIAIEAGVSSCVPYLEDTSFIDVSNEPI